MLAVAATLASLGTCAALASSSGGAAPPPDPTAPAPTAPASAPGAVVFPVRGPHTYGQGFGAARAGHSHQGQDVLAACGTPLVSPVAGRVLWRRRQAAAGNYIVIRGFSPARQDYAFMHLMGPGVVLKGQTVTAGQPIGWVGRTGDATTCHLHFELWLAPGYYRGGHPVNPVSTLQAWDAIS